MLSEVTNQVILVLFTNVKLENSTFIHNYSLYQILYLYCLYYENRAV